MSLPAVLARLRLPVIGAPMFLVSGPELVIAQCKAGIVGAFPALNAREEAGEPVALEVWLAEITEALAAHDRAHPERPAAPFAVNQIVHRSNTRLERDVEICAKWKVPIWITSLGARPEVFDAARGAGALCFHDVIHDAHARKAIDKGASGLVAVAAGAGGHGGRLSPFALVAEIRRWFEGPLALSGAIATGGAVLAAEAMGADLAYIGSAFIATDEARAQHAYKRMIVEGSAADIVMTDRFTGVPGNYLAPSIRAQGIDPERLSETGAQALDLGGGAGAKAWRDIWGAGQGIGAVEAVRPAAELVDRLERGYLRARERVRLP